MGKAHLSYIGPLKFLLILGVIIIHSNIAESGPPFTNAGIATAYFVSSQLGKAFVPSFFIISGYLFFWGVGRFTFSIYKQKLQKRFYSLVVPYILWNLICVGLLYFKFRWLDYESYGVFGRGGTIDFVRFAEGFWDFHEGYPYALAFWFIRNLICFVVLSPIVYIIGRKWWISLMLILVCIAANIWLYYLEFFLIGATLSMNNYSMQKLRLPVPLLLLVLAVYLFSAYIIYTDNFGEVYLPVYFMLTLSGFVVYLNLALWIEHVNIHKLGSLLIQSTFFLYAFHQCFCSLVRKIWLSLVGDSTTYTALISYAGSFVSMVVVSFVVWLLLRRIAPRILNVLTGNR